MEPRLKVGIGLHNRGLFIALYADDSLLLAPSIRGLVKLRYSEFAKRNLICIIWLSTLKNRVVYVLGLELMLHMPRSGVVLPWVNDLRYMYTLVCS